MKILFYIPDIDQSKGGVRQYALGMMNVMAELTEHQFYIHHNVKDPEVLKLVEKNDHFHLIPAKVGAERSMERKKYRITRALQFLNEKGRGKDFKVRSFMDRICKKYKIDIVHSPVQEQPFSRRSKNIFTLHDVQELHFPEYFSPEDREYRARTWLYNLKRTDKIIVSYQHVKDDLLKYFGVATEKVHVLLLNMGKLWFSDLTENDLVSTDQIHSFEKYLLYPANTWQHKNHMTLLKAIANLNKENVKVNLICSGHQNEHFEAIQSKITELGLQDQVKFVGVLDEKSLYSVYQKCTGVVVPTKYEAGSFPLMESIIMGIPVITSNVTSLPETMGKDEYLFAPDDVNHMQDLIKKLWQDEAFRAANVAHTQTMQNRLFDTGAAATLRSIYQEL